MYDQADEMPTTTAKSLRSPRAKKETAIYDAAEDDALASGAAQRVKSPVGHAGKSMTQVKESIYDDASEV